MKYKEYQEAKRHGEADFSLQYYPDNRNFPTTSMPLHWHRECELIRVMTGELCVFLDNREVRGGVGDLILLPSGVLHRAEAQDSSYECVVFHPDMLCGRGNGRGASRLLPFLSGSAEPLHLPREKNPVLQELADGIFRTLCEREEAWELSVCGLLLLFFGRLYAEQPRVTHGGHGRATHQRATMTLLLQWMEENYAGDVTLSQLASVAGVNQRYLCRLVRDYTGNTPMELLNRIRIEHACLDMTVRHLNVTEAAYEVGFNDPGYFSKVFRKYRGLSPREYQKKLL